MNGPNNWLPDLTADKPAVNQYPKGATQALPGSDIGAQVTRYAGTGNSWVNGSTFPFVAPGVPGAPQPGAGVNGNPPAQAKVTEPRTTMGNQ